MSVQNIIVLFVLVLGGIYWLSERPQPEALTAKQIYVIDGDTIDVGGERYRLTGFDTPETYRAECDSERQLGDRATARLKELITDAASLTITIDPGKDKYGRGLAILRADERRVGDILVTEGLARSYTGGQRRSWC